MSRILSIFLLFCFFGISSPAQKILVLTKPGFTSRVRFYENKEISFKLHGERIIHTGKMMQLTDSNFLFNNVYPVKISDIRMIIDYKKRYWIKVLQRVTLVAGIMYYGIGTVNRIIMKDAPPVFEERFILTSASMVGSSFVLKYFSKRRYTISKKRPLKVVDVSIQ